ncbi:hypothetical protein ACLOJK_037346, partial [Asimina triloba]
LSSKGRQKNGFGRFLIAIHDLIKWFQVVDQSKWITCLPKFSDLEQRKIRGGGLIFLSISKIVLIRISFSVSPGI